MDDLTVTLTPAEQMVFRKALRTYHQDRRATFAKQVVVRRAGDAPVDLTDAKRCALVLSLIETCRQKLADDSWNVTDAD